MKYLIIDDNESIRQIIKLTINQWESAAYQSNSGQTDITNIAECSDGDDALGTYESFLPDYVLMDIQMKKVDGIKATQKILEKYPDARIIIITDNDTPSYRIAALKAGAVAFIPKENLLVLKEYLHL